jgi:hypothetical protein
METKEADGREPNALKVREDKANRRRYDQGLNQKHYQRHNLGREEGIFYGQEGIL